MLCFVIALLTLSFKLHIFLFTYDLYQLVCFCFHAWSCLFVLFDMYDTLFVA